MKKNYNQPLVEVSELEALVSICQAASPAGAPDIFVNHEATPSEGYVIGN